MADYIGEKCLVCSNKFKDGDNIVVCPECGTPYHRECYNKEGKCINTELHKKGGIFKPSAGINAVGDENLRCPRCGAANEPLSLFCDKCGMPLSIPKQDSQDIQLQKTEQPQDDPNTFGNPFNTQPFQINFSDPLCGLNPEETYDDIKLTELAAFVGPNTFYYLPMFKRMKEIGHKLTWNFSAMLFPTFYFAYRKMFLFMVLSFLLKALISLPSVIITLSTGILGNSILTDFAKSFDIKSSYFGFASNATYFLSYVLMFVTGAFSNWFYYRHAINKIKKIKLDKITSREDTRAVIKAKGGVSKLALILVPCVLIFLGIFSFFISILVSLLNYK